jgi:hypothetical protein
MSHPYDPNYERLTHRLAQDVFRDRLAPLEMEGGYQVSTVHRTKDLRVFLVRDPRNGLRAYRFRTRFAGSEPHWRVPAWEEWEEIYAELDGLTHERKTA